MPADRIPAITDANVSRIARAIAVAHAPDVHHEGAFAEDAKTILAALHEISAISNEPPAPEEPEQSQQEGEAIPAAA